MKKLSVKILMAVFIISLIAILLMLCPWFNIVKLEVNGIESLSERTVRKIIELGDPPGNLLAFNSIAAKKNLKKNAYVADAEIVKKLPSTLIVNIKERKVRGYVPYMNSFLYIDDDGRILDSQSAYTKQLPVVVGLNFKKFTLGEILSVENEDAFDTVVELSKLMIKYNLIEQIIKVDVSDSSDIHLYVNGIDVIFGDFSDANKKINTLNEILKKLSPEDKGFLYLDDVGQPTRFEYLR